jgi:hypothetical protein
MKTTMRHFYVNFSTPDLSGANIHSCACHILHRKELAAFKTKVCSLVFRATGHMIKPEVVQISQIIEIDEATANSYKTVDDPII